LKAELSHVKRHDIIKRLELWWGCCIEIASILFTDHCLIILYSMNNGTTCAEVTPALLKKRNISISCVPLEATFKVFMVTHMKFCSLNSFVCFSCYYSGPDRRLPQQESRYRKNPNLTINPIMNTF
jgi:hypothetical protein